jgi:nucleotide-binding universal stress UspA family protein
MPLFRCILLAGDFSERSRQTFRVACSLADEATTRIFVLHVAERGEFAAQPVAPVEAGPPAPAREGAWVYDDDLEGMLREFYVPTRAIEVEYLVREGDAAEGILRAAAEVDAYLIALGTRGRTGLRRLLLGSVAESVLRRSRCPVLALSAPEAAPAAGPLRAILHPTDFSDRSEPALRVARALALEQGARLIVAHAVPVRFVSEAVALTVVTDAEYEALDAIRRRTDGPDLKYPVECRMLRGDPAPSTLRAAEEAGCGLVVMGTHGRAGFGRLLMGSVAEAVLRGAHCPVLAVKSGTLSAPKPPAGSESVRR